MKKSKLIKLLNQLDGDPDIVIWNGHVRDYMDIQPKLQEGSLVKETVDHYVETCRLEECRDRGDQSFQFDSDELKSIKTIARNVSWELNEYVSKQDILDKSYEEKKVFFLSPVLQGKTSYHRGGDLEY